MRGLLINHIAVEPVAHFEEMMSAMRACALNHLIRVLVLLQILQSTIPMPMNANTAAGLQKWMIGKFSPFPPNGAVNAIKMIATMH